MVFGTFDGLHNGHISFLKQVKRHGNYLIAIVATDKNVLMLKKRLSLKSEKERLGDIKMYKLIDKAMLGQKRNPYKIIKRVKPNIICLGYDQIYFIDNLSEEIKRMKLKIKIVRLRPYKAEKYHSLIISKR